MFFIIFLDLPNADEEDESDVGEDNIEEELEHNDMGR